jgi:hypothetical protein
VTVDIPALAKDIRRAAHATAALAAAAPTDIERHNIFARAYQRPTIAAYAAALAAIGCSPTVVAVLTDAEPATVTGCTRVWIGDIEVWNVNDDPTATADRRAAQDPAIRGSRDPFAQAWPESQQLPHRIGMDRGDTT